MELVNSGSVGGFGVWDLVGEDVVGENVLEEDFLVGESHPLVNGCSLLDIGRKDGLVGTELSDCLSVSVSTFSG